jgi:hypothetical protein
VDEGLMDYAWQTTHQHGTRGDFRDFSEAQWLQQASN